MESLLATIQEKINSGLSFDMELLLDQTIEAVNQTKAEQKEVLHSVGQSFQRIYDGRINRMKDIVNTELTNLKCVGSDCCPDKQRQYRVFKTLLAILQEFPTIF